MKKGNKEAHTPNSKIGMGDFYGQAIKAKTGTLRHTNMGSVNTKNSDTKKPPKSLA